MKNTKEFIDTLVKVEMIEDSQSYGHYPFQMASENKKGELTISALMLGGDVLSVYLAAKRQIQDGATKLFLSCDFPALDDIKHDFIAVFTWKNGKLETLAIPYDPETGEVFEQIKGSEAMQKLADNFEKIAMS